jgi:Ni/Co efflux regulator RcnB
MKNLTFTGVAASALLFAVTPAQASDSFGNIHENAAPQAAGKAAENARGGRHGGNHHVGLGSWHGGVRAPGGYSAYRRPHRGFILPSYWVNPGFSFNNYSVYGLRAPNNGYYWSRYYDDAVMVNNRGYVYDSVPNVNWGATANYQPAGFPQGEYGPAISADRQVYNWGDEAADPRAGGTRQAGTYEGEWTGQYVDPERRTYRGEWDGTYTNENGQVYEGTYRGTSVGDPVYSSQPQGNGDYSNTGDRRSYPSTQYQGGYQVPYGYERYEQCLKGRGLTGGAIGGILGGFLGNRIAGRGDRLPGTLIGGGIGALAGVAVEKAANKCKKYLPRQTARPQQYYPQQQGYYPQYPAGYGWQGGYYYPQQPTVTTITVTPGTTTTTTETTEEVIYETVRATRYKGKGLRRPAPTKKRCHC